MSKTVLLAILAVVVLSTGDVTYASQCPPQHIWDKGCVKLCTHPDFANCGDVFPAIFNPSFCALERSGRWKSETFACQACKDNNVVGVKNGKCGCQLEGCPSGQQCLNGACQTVVLPPVIRPPVVIPRRNCPQVPCPSGQRCVFNRCIPSDIIDRPDDDYCKTERDCKNFQFCLKGKCVDKCATIRCGSGLTCIQGQCVPRAQCRGDHQCRNGFKCNSQGRCVDKCADIFCIATTRCINGICVPLCENVNCPVGTQCVPSTGTCSPIPGFCANSNSCRSDEVCRNNQCVNFCAITTCLQGTVCRGRECVPIPGFCANSNSCNSNQVCRNNRCVNFCAINTCTQGTVCRGRECVVIDRCQSIHCPVNTRCNNGTCVPIEGFCLNHAHCPSGQVCENGRCINKCALILCPPGTTCNNGQCVRTDECQNDSQCPRGRRCSNGRCVDRCLGVVCPSGHRCQSGQCVAIDNCAAVTCPFGFDCRNGKCIAVYPRCDSNSDCKSNQICQANTCVVRDRCQGVRCPLGSRCVDGECRPNLNVCPTDAEYSVNVCTSPRPTLHTCPVLNYIVAPAPEICGVRADGTRINFVRTCEACLDSSIEYYFNTPCHSAPIVCEKKQECNGYYCSPYCKTQQDCPYDWQLCGQNRCLDRCSVMRCANCKYGQCGFVQPYGNCRSDSDCANDRWTCVGYKCVDQCWNVRCPSGFSCNRGTCVRAILH